VLEGPFVAGVINYYGENGERLIAEEVVRSKSVMTRTRKLRIAYRPYQVVGAISPWNFPVILGLEDLIAAMTAGSAAVAKPSEITPLTVMHIIDAWKSEIGGTAPARWRLCVRRRMRLQSTHRPSKPRL
jgi:acyl-CoA reductase-like NAD-dependent aldehyde dehydrogenase